MVNSHLETFTVVSDIDTIRTSFIPIQSTFPEVFHFSVNKKLKLPSQVCKDKHTE